MPTDIGVKQLVEYGLLAGVLWGVFRIGFWLLQEHMKQTNVHNAAVITQMGEHSKQVTIAMGEMTAAVKENTNRVNSLMVALVGTDIVELKKKLNGKDSL